jgi:hypothetical protein
MVYYGVCTGIPWGTGGGTDIYTTTTYDDGAWYHAAMQVDMHRIGCTCDYNIITAVENHLKG